MISTIHWQSKKTFPDDSWKLINRHEYVVNELVSLRLLEGVSAWLFRWLRKKKKCASCLAGPANVNRTLLHRIIVPRVPKGGPKLVYRIYVVRWKGEEEEEEKRRKNEGLGRVKSHRLGEQLRLVSRGFHSR